MIIWSLSCKCFLLLSLIMNVYKVYNLPILHPTWQKTLHHSSDDEYLALSSDGGSATIPLECEHDDFCIYNGTYMSVQYSTVSHRKTFLVSLHIVCEWGWINKTTCNCEVKPETQNVGYNLNRNLWAISDLATVKLQICCLHKAYHIYGRTTFQLVFLPNACDAYCRNTYIPAMVDLTIELKLYMNNFYVPI